MQYRIQEYQEGILTPRQAFLHDGAFIDDLRVAYTHHCEAMRNDGVATTTLQEFQRSHFSQFVGGRSPVFQLWLQYDDGIPTLEFEGTTTQTATFRSAPAIDRLLAEHGTLESRNNSHYIYRLNDAAIFPNILKLYGDATQRADAFIREITQEALARLPSDLSLDKYILPAGKSPIVMAVSMHAPVMGMRAGTAEGTTLVWVHQSYNSEFQRLFPENRREPSALNIRGGVKHPEVPDDGGEQGWLLKLPLDKALNQLSTAREAGRLPLLSQVEKAAYARQLEHVSQHRHRPPEGPEAGGGRY